MTTPDEAVAAGGTPVTVAPIVGWVRAGKSKAHLFNIEDVKDGNFLIRAACGRAYERGVIDGLTPKCSKCARQAARLSTANTPGQGRPPKESAS